MDDPTLAEALTDDEQRPLIHVATLHDQADIVECLVHRFHVSPLQRLGDGSTPLHIALRWWYTTRWRPGVSQH